MSVTVSRRPTAVPQPALAPSEAESIAAYESLAAEYDSPAHETTRLLERASLIALQRSGLQGILETRSPWVVELGTGTGALTAGLLEAQRAGRLLMSDPVPGMLRSALTKLKFASSGVVLEPLLASAAETLATLTKAPDLVAAGLCDPYLSAELLLLAKEIGGRTQTFVTIPGSAWAARERNLRLHLPVDQTRFRLANGRAVHSRSMALHEVELVRLFKDCEFEVVSHGTVRLPSSGQRPAPEVVWCWAGIGR